MRLQEIIDDYAVHNKHPVVTANGVDHHQSTGLDMTATNSRHHTLGFVVVRGSGVVDFRKVVEMMETAHFLCSSGGDGGTLVAVVNSPVNNVVVRYLTNEELGHLLRDGYRDNHREAAVIYRLVGEKYGGSGRADGDNNITGSNSDGSKTIFVGESYVLGATYNSTFILARFDFLLVPLFPDVYYFDQEIRSNFKSKLGNNLEQEGVICKVDSGKGDVDKSGSYLKHFIGWSIGCIALLMVVVLVYTIINGGQVGEVSFKLFNFEAKIRFHNKES